ncbi:MAG TPA: N-acetylmuramoyl-L-alanine amidase [Kofleriaceae bacterium]|nr:N-acetylmuramoyl-L-alanine amidase [Kofleriaceae bacterium]
MLLLGVGRGNSSPALSPGSPSPGPSEAAIGPIGPGPLVVIDPGHGGTNMGAPGVVPGVFEKHVTLAIAALVGRELSARGLNVVLTHTEDEYLTLRHRVRRANQLGADLFISIHANATPAHGQRGYETFVLSPRGVDVDGRALRIEDGPARVGTDLETARILDEVERGIAVSAAADLAVAIQTELRAIRGTEGDRGVRQESHHVLLGATMPAVLVEVGFIDHPVEGRELTDPAVQATIARALAAAITTHLTE